MAYPFNPFSKLSKTDSKAPWCYLNAWMKRVDSLRSSRDRLSSRVSSHRKNLLFEALEPRLLLSGDIPLVPPDMFTEEANQAAIVEGLLAAGPATSAIVMGMEEVADRVGAAHAEVERLPLLNRDIDVIERSLGGWLDVEPIFSVGDYLDHYLHPALYSDIALAADDPIPAGDYAATHGIPTLDGLSDYLETHWIGGAMDGAGFTGGEGVPLSVDYTGDVLTIEYADTLRRADEMVIEVDDYLTPLGVAMTEDLALAATTALDVAFVLTVDASAETPETRFDLSKLDVSVTGEAGNIALGADFGPLTLALGTDFGGGADADGGHGSVHLDLGGAIAWANGEAAFELATDAEGNTRNTLEVDLPVHASLSGQGLAVSTEGAARITLAGGILPEAGNALVFATHNFDHLLSLENFDAETAVGMIEGVSSWLADVVSETDLMTGAIPFLSDVTQKKKKKKKKKK